MRAKLLLLAGQTIALGLMMAFLVVPASALFLDEYGADALAYAYLAVAAAGVAVSVGLSRAQRRLSLASLATTVFLVYLVVVAGAWATLSLADGVWVTFPLLVLFPLSIPVGFTMVGGQAGRLLDVRQMKAYFPRVAAGFAVGFAVGGVVAALLVGPLGGPEHLLGVDLATAAAMVALVVEIGRRFPTELRTPPPRTTGGSSTPTTSRRALLRNRLVVVIFGYQVLSAMVTQLLDFMVWERAAARYPDPSDLARFQGVFGAIINVTSVVFVVAVAGWLLTRYGIGIGLLANPVAVLALLVVTAVVGTSAGLAAFVFFVLVCALQVTDISLTDGTTRTSINATYQALLPQQRFPAQTMIEAAGVPIALGFVGLLLIGRNALGLDVRAVVLVTIVFTLVWTVAAVLAYREYGANLREVLSRRAWDPVALHIDDEASRAAVQSLLTSGDARDVETALGALTDAGSPEITRHLTDLLSSPDPDRRRLAAETVGARSLVDAPGVVTALAGLLTDPEPAVRLSAAAAMVDRDADSRALWLAAVAGSPSQQRLALEAAAGSPDAFFLPHLVELAASESAPVEIIDALAAHADHLMPLAGSMLGDAAFSNLTRQRIVAALGESGSPSAQAVLVAHLNDADPAVSEAAARVLATVGHREPPGATGVAEALAAQGVRGVRLLQVQRLAEGLRGADPLVSALHDELGLAGTRAEVLLGLAHEPQVVSAGLAGLRSEIERDRNTALEMLEVTLGRPTARLLQAIVSPGLDVETRLELLAGADAEQGKPLVEWLRELVRDPAGYWAEPWLRACALYALPATLPAEARLLASPYVDDPDPVVAETARWVVGRPPSG